MPNVNINPGNSVAMTITNLNGLANSATAGWQSARVDNTSLKAVDFQVSIKLDLANTAAANDKAVYVYAVPWYHDGTAWTVGADGGTTTPPSGSEGVYTVGATTHNMRLARTLVYSATDQTVHGHFNVLDIFGSSCPDGWSLVILNYSGAALAASGNAILYKPITFTVT